MVALASVSANPKKPREAYVILEVVEVSPEKYSNWIRKGRSDKIRAVVEKWIDNGEAKIVQTLGASVRSGQKAKVESIYEYPYLTDEPRYRGDEDEGEEDAPAAEPVDVVKDQEPPMRVEIRNTGITFDVTAEISEDGTQVDLDMLAEMVTVIAEPSILDAASKGEGKKDAKLSPPHFVTVRVEGKRNIVGDQFTLMGATRGSHEPFQTDPKSYFLMFVKCEVINGKPLAKKVVPVRPLEDVVRPIRPRPMPLLKKRIDQGDDRLEAPEVYIGQHIDQFRSSLKKRGFKVLELDEENNQGPHFPDIQKCRFKLSLVEDKWLIEAVTWASTGIVHEIRYTHQNGMIPEHVREKIMQLNSPPNTVLPKEQPTYEPNKDKPVTITIRSKELDELLEFKKRWSVMGLTLKELEQRFGEGKLDNPGQKPPKYIFEKFDPEHNVNWSITVDMWQGDHNKEPVAQQVYYERKTKFSFKELTWLREINSKGWKWDTAGAKPPWLKYKTVIPVMPGKKPDLVGRPELRAGVKHMDPRKFEAPLIVLYSLN